MCFFLFFLHWVGIILFERFSMPFTQKIIWLIFLFFSGYFSWVYFESLSDNSEWRNYNPLSSIISSQGINSHSSVFDSKKAQEAKQLIESQYYHFSEKRKEDIENQFITALVGSVGDKHSSYFPPKIASEFKDSLRGDFEWIGAVIDENPKGIKVQKIFKNSPAEKGWLKNGDILTMVDTTRLVGMKTDIAVDKIRWPKGSKITVKYLRGENNTENITEITRDRVLIPSVQEKMLTGSVGYIEIAFFGEHTEDEFTTSLKNIMASWATGIILDFRNNPGGFLESAVNILSQILPPESKAVITRENDPKKDETMYTKWFLQPNTKTPIIMLVNGLSASASEIVAGALQDYGRAILIGEKTYGKWSVQTPFSMSDGSMLKLTIGRWYTPKDRWIDGEGITPDIIISLKDEDYTKQHDRQLAWAEKVMNEFLKNGGSTKKTLSIAKTLTF